MAGDTENEMDEDSRTATFERKRTHDIAAGDDNSNAGSTKSTPRKRAKYGGKVGYRDVRDFVPNGASFSTSTVPLVEDHVSEEEDSVGHVGREARAEITDIPGDGEDFEQGGSTIQEIVPPSPHIGVKTDDPANHFLPSSNGSAKDAMMNGSSDKDHAQVVEAGLKTTSNWNVVNNIRIRTSLGSGLGRVKIPENNTLPQKIPQSQVIDAKDEAISPQNGDPNPRQGTQTLHKEATRTARARLEGFRKRIASMDAHDGPVPAYKTAQQELEDAEIDYNYCLHYPKNETFIPPLDLLRERKSKIPPATHNQSQHIRNLVKKCMQRGTLQDLEDGKYTKPTIHPYINSPSEPAISTEDMGMVHTQSFDIEMLLGYLEGVRKALKCVPRKSGAHPSLNDKYQTAQADLNYCQNFPSTENYLCLFRVKKGLQEPDDVLSVEGSRNKRAAQVWHLAQQCAQNGTLKDLREGRINQVIGGAPAPDHAFAKVSPQTIELYPWHKPRKPKWSREARKEREHVPGEPKSSVVVIDVDDSQPASVEGRNSNDQGDREDVLVAREIPEPPSNTKPIGAADSPRSHSDGYLDLDTYGDGGNLSSEEVLYSEQAPNGTVEGFEMRTTEIGTAENSPDDETAEDSGSDLETESDSEEDDAMMEYSNLEQAGKDEAHHIESDNTKSARILAELSQQDLKDQMRYFYITKTPNQVNLNTPVRCLVCAQHGHMAEVCPSLSCDACGAHNEHITRNCPSNTKCSKCREVGHSNSQCPYKLKNLTANEIICDLCQQNGHIEEDCELTWRTSGRPWDFDFDHPRVRLSCYECGMHGHLGNDCPTRRPGKTLGTSTWGAGQSQLSIKSKTELRIKGSARQDPIDLDNDEGEINRPLIGPKVPEPVRKGKIQIKTSSKPSFQDERPYSGWNPVNGSSHSDTNNRPQYNDQRDSVDRRRGDIPSSRPSLDSNPRHKNSYRPTDRGGYTPSNGHHPLPPRPSGFRNQFSGSTYRSMPSAAQNAWSKHRV